MGLTSSATDNAMYTITATNTDEVINVARWCSNILRTSGKKFWLFFNAQGTMIDNTKFTKAAITAIKIWSDIYIILLEINYYKLTINFIGAWSDPSISVKIKLFLIFFIYFS